MILIIDHRLSEIWALSEYPDSPGPIRRFACANNIDRQAIGPLPTGLYREFELLHKGQPPGGSMGKWFLWIKDVADRTEMGLHAGREGVPDGLGRTGWQHCTMGCPRTTESAMTYIAQRWHLADYVRALLVL